MNPVLSVFNGYPFQHICNFLEPKDIVNMCHTFPYQWKKVYYRYRDCIKNKIDSFFREYFGEKYNEFRKIMVKSRAVISGSFIIQMILGERWPDSDIDFYVPIIGSLSDKKSTGNHIVSLIDEFLYLKGNHFWYTSQNMYQTGPKTNIKYIRDYIKMNDEQIKRCENLNVNDANYMIERQTIDNLGRYNNDTNCNIKLQVISVDLEPNYDIVKNHIYKNFDLDICKNIFYYDNEGPKLNMFNARSIIDKKTKFNFNYGVCEPLKRYKKYLERGFQFNESNEEIFKSVVDNSHFDDRISDKVHKKYNVFLAEVTEEDSIDKLRVKRKYKILKNLSGDEFKECDCDYECNGKKGISYYHYVCADSCPIKILFKDRQHIHYSYECNYSEKMYYTNIIFLL